MSLVSMTGFSRVSGSQGAWRWAWELKSVNARGLDLRLRCPSGFDAVEAEARTRLGKRLGRGAIYANLSGQREASTPEVRVNETALAALQDAVARVPKSPDVQPASMDGLLNIRGIVEIADAGDSEEELAALHKDMLATLDQAVDALVAMRKSEGAALEAVLRERIDAIARLTASAEDCPDRKPEIVRERLERSVRELTGASPALDPARLHQEALLLAAKADVREELDRLHAHVAAVRELLGQDGPVGRRLDFLAQELGREANTLCSKSNGAALTAIGMELRVQVEQFREQVQNIE
ncbi:MAG: YicC family protein [Hyphomicrobiales bacterium]|nr:YicC family protein [Hyphomicrobiales bacterium]